MDEPKPIKEPGTAYAAPVADLDRPIILQRDGRPVAAVISIEEYERYQAALRAPQTISSSEARRAADRAVFRDLVGCALSSGEPVWEAMPSPHWLVPYRAFDGTWLTQVRVDARTRAVSLTDEEHSELLERIERLTAREHATT